MPIITMELIYINDFKLTLRQNGIVFKLFKKGVIGDHYRPTNIVCRIASCSKKELKELAKYGLVTDRGKSWKVAALKKQGALYAKGLKKKELPDECDNV